MNFRTRLLSILTLHLGNLSTFNLQQVYQVAEGPMSFHYPNNNTVDASIRHNLQKLRDEGFLTFVDDEGTYQWV